MVNLFFDSFLIHSYTGGPMYLIQFSHVNVVQASGLQRDVKDKNIIEMSRIS